MSTLGSNDAIANLTVKDLARAKKFYEGTLGLKAIAAEGDELIVFQSGKSKLFVYRSKYAGTNNATALSWEVGGEVEALARALKTIAWFKDPDGNILSIVSG